MLVASADKGAKLAPGTDGSWPPLPGAVPVELKMDKSFATGQTRISLSKNAPACAVHPGPNAAHERRGKDELLTSAGLDTSRSRRPNHRWRQPQRAEATIAASKLGEAGCARGRRRPEKAQRMRAFQGYAESSSHDLGPGPSGFQSLAEGVHQAKQADSQRPPRRWPKLMGTLRPSSRKAAIWILGFIQSGTRRGRN